MADELSIAWLDLLRKADPVERADFVRQAVERLAQAIVEVEQEVGAVPSRAPRAPSPRRSGPGQRRRRRGRRARAGYVRTGRSEAPREEAAPAVRPGYAAPMSPATVGA